MSFVNSIKTLASLQYGHLIKSDEQAHVYCEDTNLTQVKMLIDNSSKKARDKVFAKAAKYNIPYDDDTCPYELTALIHSYKELLDEYASYNKYWELSWYDPVALKQEIFWCRLNDQYDKKCQAMDYYSNCL